MTFVLDACAIIAYLRNENGAEAVEAICLLLSLKTVKPL
jgi:PIN domain nuclease of toxin-antitoxin system